MTVDIRAILSPLLIISYVFGARIIEFTAGESRPWLGVLYILLSWSLYHFLLVYTVMYYIHDDSVIYVSCFWLNNCTVLLSIGLAIYYDKKFKSCLKKLAIVDDTLQKIGTTTDYQKLHRTMLWIVFGWFVLVVWINYNCTLWYKKGHSAIKAFYISFILGYTCYVHLIDDLIMMSVLGYIGLKFDQMNQFIRNMGGDNKRTATHEWKYSLRPKRGGYWRSINNECVTWIVIHLHLELRKISRELNSIFGLQMTIKVGVYFAYIALGFHQLFDAVFANYYVDRRILYIILVISFLIINIFRLLIINYMCEEVSTKANVIGDIINRISYSTYDIVVRENISQLVLQVNLTPLKFYGLGLFQFGLKFFHGFSSSVTTIIVILVQSHTKT